MVLCICIAPLYGYAGIYGYVDDRGVYHFTNIAPVGKRYHTIIPDRSKITRGKAFIENDRYDKMIVQHSKTHGVDPSLVKAVMRAESNFDPNAVSQKGAQGLMQLMPGTAKLMNVSDPFDPDENIKGGAKYLKLLDETFQGNLELVLAAYNAGPQKVIDHKMSVPPIEETRTFVERVKHFYNKLKKPYEG